MKCKQCDIEMQMSREIYTSYPPKRKFICPMCHNVEFIELPLFSNRTSDYREPISCAHNFQVNFVNGEYLSVCTRCGKIGDRYTNPISLTCEVIKECDE